MPMIDPHDASGRSDAGSLIGMTVVGVTIIATAAAILNWLTS